MIRFSIFQRGVLGLALAAATLPAAPIQWTAAMGGNDNWYEYVPAISIFAPVDFATARADALSRTHMGLSGYLATITSASEQTFVQSSFPFLLGFGATGAAHLGASDEAEEGTFRWLDGPEAGKALSYTNWAVSHPTGTGDTLALYINAVVFGAPPFYAWVDTNPSAFGYVIEYGDGVIDTVDPGDPSGVPEPSAFLLSAAGLAAVGLRVRRRN